MISGLYLKQLIRGTEYGEENVADGKRQDSILDIRISLAGIRIPESGLSSCRDCPQTAGFSKNRRNISANHGIALSGTLLHMENRDRSA